MHSREHFPHVNFSLLLPRTLTHDLDLELDYGQDETTCHAKYLGQGRFVGKLSSEQRDTDTHMSDRVLYTTTKMVVKKKHYLVHVNQYSSHQSPRVYIISVV